MPDLVQKCFVCGALLDEEDLFCANCGASAPESDPSRLKLDGVVGTHSFECSGCGASMSYSAEGGTLRCPFCGTNKLQQRADHRVLAARRVVPFRVSHEMAASALRKFLGSSFWHPADLSRAALVSEMSAVYVPYWVFGAATHTHWTADSGQVPWGARGNWIPVTGEHRGSYQGILIGASGALTPAETEAICPFDLSDGQTPAGFTYGSAAIEQFTVPRKYARPLARAGLEASEAQACARRYLVGRHRNLKVNVRIENLTSEPVLLPVWIMAYRYRQRLYRFIVNGQTGRARGQAPFSKAKVVLVALAVLAALAALLGVILAFD